MFLPFFISPNLSFKKTLKKIKICHSPTDRHYKGSNKIIDVCKKIEEENSHVEFVLIENMSHNDVMEIKKTCDILIDQVGDFGGWGYGMNSVESMALGLCCMTQMNSVCDSFFTGHPFININKNNLEGKLNDLISNPLIIDEYKNRSIQWVKDKHGVKKVGEILYKNYADLLNE
jgi:hypothetical protein